MAETATAAFEQPESFAFDAESQAEIATTIAKYPAGKQASGVLPLLWIAQRQMGRQTNSAWVPVKAMDEIARILEIAPIRVYEVCTFYLMFNTAPVGKFHLQLCTTTPCWLRGSDDVVAACRSATGLKGWKEISADGLFSMTEVECLGACGFATPVMINNDFIESVTPESVPRILSELK